MDGVARRDRGAEGGRPPVRPTDEGTAPVLDDTYRGLLARLSHQSVVKHFDAYGGGDRLAARGARGLRGAGPRRPGPLSPVEAPRALLVAEPDLPQEVHEAVAGVGGPLAGGPRGCGQVAGEGMRA